jgi:hypothetical protein
MSELITAPPDSKSLTELQDGPEKINEIATSQASEEAKSDTVSIGERYKLQIKREREDLSQVKRINEVQLSMLDALFRLIKLWLFSVMLVVAIRACKLARFELSDKVMITYITSTTVSVLGLFHIAARWLFSRRD